jgi:hypothetical protein
LYNIDANKLDAKEILAKFCMLDYIASDAPKSKVGFGHEVIPN